jgi:hypothetical protein
MRGIPKKMFPSGSCRFEMAADFAKRNICATFCEKLSVSGRLVAARTWTFT